jgi:hypothetical protein
MITSNSQTPNHVIKKKNHIIRKHNVGDDVKNEYRDPIGEVVYLGPGKLSPIII